MSVQQKMKAVIKDPQHCKRLVMSLQSFNNNNTLIDLCFVCAKGQKVYAHKLLLCTVSSQMKKIFLELPDCLQEITIHLPDVEAHMLELMFDFLYEGSVRVTGSEYADIQQIMNMLGIVLTPPGSQNEEKATNQPPPPVPPVVPPAPQQPPQLVYLPQTQHSQGQVQYMLAQGPLTQGQVMMPSAVQTQQPSSQPMIISQSSGQMVQAGAQVGLLANQVQQGNVVQIVQQNNGQVVPINNQISNGGQIVQCSNQMVVQGNQQAIMSNNQAQIGVQNQVAQNNYVTSQQQPQYVMSSMSSQLTSRAVTQYTQPSPQVQTVNQHRGRPTHQPQGGRIANVSTEVMMNILQEDNEDVGKLTAKNIRENLKKRLNIDLSAEQEKSIGEVLKTCLGLPKTSTDVSSAAVESAGCSLSKTLQEPRKLRKRRNIPFYKSDDEDDMDFLPKKSTTKSALRKKKNKA